MAEASAPIETGRSVGRVLGLAGCTNSGKTTMAEFLKKMFLEEGATVCIVNQDDFFLSEDKVEKIYPRENDRNLFYYNYDTLSAIDTITLADEIRKARDSNDYVVLEGHMITEMENVLELCDRIIFLSLDQGTCRRRRELRKYEPPDIEGYFDDIVWPAYQKHLQGALSRARDDHRFCFLDVSSSSDSVSDQQMVNLIHSMSDDILRICYEPLCVEETTNLGNSPSCGATSVFIGTTRDTFNGLHVVRLDYESYDEMAYKEMRKICSSLREKYPSIERIVIFHRIGEVPVGEASVIIATSSPHRKEAIAATEMAIDLLKARVPIWKKEIYSDGNCSWKENGECCGGAQAIDSVNSIGAKGFSSQTPNRNSSGQVMWLRQMIRLMRLQPNIEN